MKKFINDIETILSESLDGFAAAHADIVVLGEEAKFVRRRSPDAGQGRADLGRRIGPRAAACRLRRAGHARCRLPRPGVHLPDAGPDGRGRQRCRCRCRVPVHRQELRRRRDELRDGRRDGSQRGAHRHHRRRRCSRELTLYDRAARRRRYARGREDRRGRRGSDGRACGIAGARPPGQCADPLDGRRADILHGAGCRQADLCDCRGRNGTRRRHSRRAGATARAPRTRRPDRRGDDGARS